MQSVISLTREPIDYHALAESVRDPHCGAVALFLGTVRDLTGEFVTVFLDYEAYGPMAEKKLAEIGTEMSPRKLIIDPIKQAGTVIDQVAMHKGVIEKDRPGAPHGAVHVNGTAQRVTKNSAETRVDAGALTHDPFQELD